MVSRASGSIRGQEESGADRQRVRAAEVRVRLGLHRVDPHVRHRGQAALGAVQCGGGELTLHRCHVGARDLVARRHHGHVDHHTRRMALRVPEKPAACGIGNIRSDTQDLHGLRVDQGGMAVDAGDPHGVVRHRGRERVVGRELLLGPVVLVPAAAPDPGAGGHLRGGLAHAPDHLVVRRRIHEIDLRERLAQAREMRVGVDQAGRYRAAGQVDHPGLRTAEACRTRVRPEVDDPAAADGEAAFHLRLRLDGVEHPVCQDEVGGVLCIGGSAGQSDPEKAGKEHGLCHKPTDHQRFLISEHLASSDQGAKSKPRKTLFRFRVYPIPPAMLLPSCRP